MTKPTFTADRRGFLKGSSLGALTAALGVAIPFGAYLPQGLMPVALAADPPAGPEVGEAELMKAKDGLTNLGDRPVNLETPAHLLDDDVTPSNRHFVRNHGVLPEPVIKMDAAGWTLTIDGEVNTPLKLTIGDLKKDFEVVTRNLVIECAGNGRAYFNPPVSGNQWTIGAVACSAWTGVRLRDVLSKAGLKASAVYTGHYGSDIHLSRAPDKQALSRGVPVKKAMDENNLIAFEMNGKPIPALNGFPLRLIIPGWAGSVSQKWLTRIWVRDVKHDGEKMKFPAYAVPKHAVTPGAKVEPDNFETIEALPVKSLITFPQTGVKVDAKKPTEVRGHAWGGDVPVAKVELSIDFGQTWSEAKLAAAPNPYAWRRWTTQVTLPETGYFEVWVRATDEAGKTQPPVVPGWNPGGYYNNMQHRIALFAV